MDGAKRKGKHKKHGKRGAKKARGKPVTLRGKLFGIGKRGRRVTFRADRAVDVADFMDGARGKAAARRARAAAKAKAARKPKNGRRRKGAGRKKPRSAAQKRATAKMLAALHAKRGGRHGGRRGGGRKRPRTEAQVAATRRLVAASCVQKVMKQAHAHGTDMTYTQAHHMCREMREASVKAAAASASVRPSPAAPTESEQYAAACRREFKAVLGNQVEKLEAKYCRAGWTRQQVRSTLETIAKQMAAT